MKSPTYWKELGAALFLLFMIFLTILAVNIFSSFLHSASENYNWLYWLVGYIGLVILLLWIQRKFKTVFLKNVCSVVLTPMWLLYFVLSFDFIFIVLILHLLIFLILCFAIPIICLKIYGVLDFTPLSSELALYIVLTVAVISSVILLKPFRYLVYKISPAGGGKSSKLKPYDFEGMSNYLISENNVKFVVFGIYFLLLILTNFYSLQGASFYGSSKYDQALLQSFVTYIAFDRIISSIKQSEFTPFEMFSKIIKSFSRKLDQLGKTEAIDADEQ